jgi:hypothetical protein
MKGKTQEFYDKNPEAKKKKAEYDKAFNKKKEQVEKRVELNKANRKAGTYGNGDKKDMSHTKSGLKSKPQSQNRGSKSDQPGDKRARGKK